MTLPGLPAAQAADNAPAGQLRLRWEERQAGPAGPLAEANALQPGTYSPPSSATVADVEVRHTLHARMAGQPVALGLNLLALHAQAAAGNSLTEVRANELHVSAEFDAWSASAGKKVVGWDVGYGFRPNDFVQQEARRTLLGATPEGRPLIQLERFDVDSAASVVWVNPRQLNAPPAQARGARESALAARWFERRGSIDLHAFARLGERTAASVGAAFAWVAADEVELHASARALARHEGWRIDPAAGLRPAAASPWQVERLDSASQWLVGLSWTGELQQSLLIEYWHDGTSLPDRAWDDWTSRNRALSVGTAPIAARAGNLAWQAAPFESSSLRQDSLFVRVGWQREHWSAALDALVNPADRGRIFTASAQWQGDRLRINASWRVLGGPPEAVLAQVPQQRSGLVALSWAY